MQTEHDLNLKNLTLFNAECDNSVYGVSRREMKLSYTDEGLELAMETKGITVFSFLMHREHAIRFNSDELYWPLSVNKFPYLSIEYKMTAADKIIDIPRAGGDAPKHPVTRIYMKALDGKKQALAHQVLPGRDQFHRVVIDLKKKFTGFTDPHIYMLYFNIRNFFADATEKITFKRISFLAEKPSDYDTFELIENLEKELETVSAEKTFPVYPALDNYYHFGVNSPRITNRFISKLFDIDIEDYHRMMFRDQLLNGVTFHWFFHDEANDELKKILRAAETYDIDVMTTLKSPIPLGNATAMEDLQFDEDAYTQEVAALIEEFDEYDKMKFWFLTDEPAEELQLLPFLKQKKIVEQLDKKRPLLFNLSLPDMIKDLGDSCAFHLFDSYPVIEPNPNYWRLDEETKFAKAHTSRQVWVTLQTFSMPPRFRLPTEVEFNLMKNIAISNGANGLNFHIYTNHPFWIHPHYTACLVTVFGQALPIWRQVGSLGRSLYGLKHFMPKSCVLTNNPFSLEVEDFSTIKGIQAVAKCNLLSDGEFKILYIYNNTIDQTVKYKIHATDENTTPLTRFQINDINDLPDELVEWQKISLEQEYSLAPGEDAWILVADDTTPFNELIYQNIIELERRITPAQFDAFSYLQNRDSGLFIADYLKRLDDDSEPLEALLHEKANFLAGLEKCYPEAVEYRQNLYKIRKQLTCIEEWFVEYKIDFHCTIYNDITAALRDFGKRYFVLLLNKEAQCQHAAKFVPETVKMLSEVSKFYHLYTPKVENFPKASFKTPKIFK